MGRNIMRIGVNKQWMAQVTDKNIANWSKQWLLMEFIIILHCAGCTNSIQKDFVPFNNKSSRGLFFKG